MAMERDVLVQVFMELSNLDQARVDAADWAWDHAKSAASAFGHSIGSDEHLELHEVLAERYHHSIEHMMYFMQHAFTLLEELFDTEYIRLKTDEGPLDDKQVCDRIAYMAQAICRSYIHLMAGYESLWPTNDMLPPSLVSNFYFTEEEINTEEIQ